jgi:hypothetical protein
LDPLAFPRIAEATSRSGETWREPISRIGHSSSKEARDIPCLYADRTAEQLRSWEAQSGRQPFDPAKLAQALLVIASQESPPPRFIAGADAFALAEQKVAALRKAISAYRELSTPLALDEVDAAGNWS